MTEQQLNKANRLMAERDDIQGLIDFLTDNPAQYYFGVETEKRYAFLKVDVSPIFRKRKKSKGFGRATREALVKALVEQRDKLTKEIEEI